MDDALTERLWTNEEDEVSKAFVDNILTIFTGSGTPASQILAVTSANTMHVSKPDESATSK